MELLGRYRVEAEIVRFKGAVVYSARDSRLDRPVVIKSILQRELDAEDYSDQLKMFRREARAARLLTGIQAVAQVYDLETVDGNVYLTMEPHVGRNLKAMLDEKMRLSEHEALPLAIQLLDALDLVHQNGVIHQNISPANLLIGPEGGVKIADFGLSAIKAQAEASELDFEAGSSVGTPAYLSPERKRGDTADEHADLFAAGVVTYQMLTGRLPFARGNRLHSGRHSRSASPPSPSAIGVKVSGACEKILLTALADRPGARFDSARTFADALRDAGL
jgi:serine/threonine-protein kinase